MGIFGRLFKMGQAEAHSLVDKLEDPIKLTEQGIRDLKEDLDKSLKAYAEVKALAIRSRKEANQLKSKAADYEQKAMLLLQRAEAGQIDPMEADRLASEALAGKEDAMRNALSSEQEATKIEQNVQQLDGNIKKLRSNISHYENELRTLKARSKVSKATTKLNKQMANIDGTGTIAMLEKMKTKVTEQESLAEAYGDIADASKSVDDEINDVLNSTAVNPKGSSALEALKAKMNQGKQI